MPPRPLRYALAIAAIVAVSAMGTRIALADEHCNVPLANWKPVKDLDSLARSQGWNVDKIKTDDGCYVIRGTDRDGRRFKAKVNPGTLEIMRMKSGDDDDGHGRHRWRGEHGAERGRGAQSATPGSTAGDGASGAAPAGGVLTPGTRPQVQIN
ncbi:PepSY domain-containing protein [Paraburkholderia dinghuensis]|uniref:PepSY domain-containing protein n=2 Tax=Paraburkholderia dinghuensis TaxID=2305225 RepID=A0A3N6MT54_9BURK|nr:PepSY domain-containing protein [Paraburkholderia dinghuensis]